jgi:uncharacterized tellurite resistance protein B-like protein
MEHIDSQYAKDVFERMDEVKKFFLSKSLVDMAMADGYLDPREQRVIDFYES